MYCLSRSRRKRDKRGLGGGHEPVMVHSLMRFGYIYIPPARGTRVDTVCHWYRYGWICNANIGDSIKTYVEPSSHMQKWFIPRRRVFKYDRT